MLKRRQALIMALAVAACESQPPLPPPPFDLVSPPAPIPGPAAVRAVAAAFADGGASLGGRPAEMAQAAAQLEYLADEVPRSPPWLPLPIYVGYELRAARVELRAALGMDPGASGTVAMNALLRVARALRAGKTAEAEQALQAPLFRPGGAASLARLREPGALPQCANATSLAQDELDRAMQRGPRTGIGAETDVRGSGAITGGILGLPN